MLSVSLSPGVLSLPPPQSSQQPHSPPPRAPKAPRSPQMLTAHPPQRTLRCQTPPSLQKNPFLRAHTSPSQHTAILPAGFPPSPASPRTEPPLSSPFQGLQPICSPNPTPSRSLKPPRFPPPSHDPLKSSHTRSLQLLSPRPAGCLHLLSFPICRPSRDPPQPFPKPPNPPPGLTPAPPPPPPTEFRPRHAPCSNPARSQSARSVPRGARREL